jgi:hypothetical protein
MPRAIESGNSTAAREGSGFVSGARIGAMED